MLVESQEKCFSFHPDVFTRPVQSLPSESKSEFQISEQVKLLFPVYSCIYLFCRVARYSVKISGWHLGVTLFIILIFVVIPSIFLDFWLCMVNLLRFSHDSESKCEDSLGILLGCLTFRRRQPQPNFLLWMEGIVAHIQGSVNVCTLSVALNLNWELVLLNDWRESRSR